jgi:AAA+ ATPase superfamily predicted ATPase
MINPFITTGYSGAKYFCDRVKETNDLVGLLTNGNNIALVSPRRYGKTDLIRHCFAQETIKENYYTFIIDIYSTLSLAEMADRMGKVILEELKPKGKKVWEGFINTLVSLRTCITYDAAGVPTWSVELGDIRNPSNTLNEIFKYLQNADRPCLVAIDEFQQILKYEDKNVEAAVRTYVQYCSNANFIFSGSQREMMGAMFTSASRPFYQSATIINLPRISEDKYSEFSSALFEESGKHLDADVVPALYSEFDGTTFYLQKMMNILFMRTSVGDRCSKDNIQEALDYLLDLSSDTYEDLLYQLPEKQKQILLVISREGKARNITSSAFVRKYSLPSASSVSSAVKGLLDRGLLTCDRGVYQVYDYFLDIWIRERYLKTR